jgi:hypothetical protein
MEILHFAQDDIHFCIPAFLNSYIPHPSFRALARNLPFSTDGDPSLRSG